MDVWHSVLFCNELGLNCRSPVLLQTRVFKAVVWL